jgi:hypothetical protein
MDYQLLAGQNKLFKDNIAKHKSRLCAAAYLLDTPRI